MTEKRFYYNTFYYPNTDRVMEYEIIDRESFPNYPNHDEAEDIPSWYIYIDGGNDSNWQDMCIDKLNKLHEEKEIAIDGIKIADKLIKKYGSEELKLQWKKEVTVKYR